MPVLLKQMILIINAVTVALILDIVIWNLFFVVLFDTF